MHFIKTKPENNKIINLSFDQNHFPKQFNQSMINGFK